METWYLPITILPGIGLLILSATHLIVSLNEELERLLQDADEFRILIDQKLSQMRLLTFGMSGLYMSTALMVLSGLISFSSRFDIVISGKAGSIVLLTGVGFIFLSLIFLVIYSAKAVGIRRAHFDDCLINENKSPH